jgi:polyphosphate kinase
MARVVDEKSIPAFKINILWAMGDSIPNSVPTQFQESIFPPITPLKIQAQKAFIRLTFNVFKALIDLINLTFTLIPF